MGQQRVNPLTYFNSQRCSPGEGLFQGTDQYLLTQPGANSEEVGIISSAVTSQRRQLTVGRGQRGRHRTPERDRTGRVIWSPRSSGSRHRVPTGHVKASMIWSTVAGVPRTTLHLLITWAQLSQSVMTVSPNDFDDSRASAPGDGLEQSPAQYHGLTARPNDARRATARRPHAATSGLVCGPSRRRGRACAGVSCATTPAVPDRGALPRRF